nr:retrovirus-related Pol polyprotein from transposon TNT 1-94 [Tanacetum cinerariifolium]
LVEIILFIVDSGCSKHMARNLKLLTNFVEKFLGKNDIVIGLPKLKFIKDHLCSSCELGKAKRKSFQSKTTPSLKRRLQLLHMDLCGPMRVESINGRKYVLVIADDYSRFTWTRFLRDGENLDKMKENGDACVFVGYSTQSRAYKTKDHPLDQVIGNPSQSIRTRCQLESDGEICMFALTVSRTELKNIKEAMANSAWIE